MSAEENKALVRRMWEEIWTQGKLEVAAASACDRHKRGIAGYGTISV